jgi:hypothetical protein
LTISPVQTDWDVERFISNIRELNMAGDHEARIDNELAHLKKKFKIPDGSGYIDEPATVVDKFGCIMLWHLPGIISASRIVSRAHV